MFSQKRYLHGQHGGILLPAMLVLVILSVISAVAFNTMHTKYRLAFQTASWQEALLSAEAAAEVGMNEVRKVIFDKPEESSDDPFLPENGWTEFPAEFVDTNQNGILDNGETWNPETDDHNGNGLPDPWKNWAFSSELPHRDSEGGTNSKYHAIVDIPFRHPRNNEPFYRVRAWGQMDIPGPGITSGNKEDNWLRKLSLRKERRTGQLLDRPHARRYIDVVLKPVTAFRLALFGVSSIDLNNENILVDSWDSSNTEKYPGGFYPTELNPNLSESQLKLLRNENGDIATNGKVIEAGNARIFGSAATNGGTEGQHGVLNAKNVTGEITNDFEQEVFAVRAPVVSNGENVGSINGATVLEATPDTVKTVTTSGIKLSGNNKLHLKGARNDDGTPVLNPDGTPKRTYIQIIVDGNMSLSGNSQIVMDEGVYVRFFIKGSADISGNGVLNPNSALHLQLYGVDTLSDGTPRGEKDESVGLIKISGNGGFKGAVYAPRFDVELKGGGNSDNVFGSFTGRKIRMTGIQQVHYDESMAHGGLVVDYKIASWFEDVR